jgi:HK97 family phage portal protein
MRPIFRKRTLARLVDERFFDYQNNVPPRGAWIGSSAGMPVTQSTATGLPGVSACIRLVSETLGMMPLIVYKGIAPDLTRARDSWQWERLHDQPNDEESAFDFWQDVQTSIEVSGNAYIWKVKSRPVPQSAEDIELFVMDPRYVEVKRENGKKVFECWNNGVKVTRDATKILHIRGWSVLAGADSAVSPITLHRETIGKALATEEFESRFFSNNAVPPFALKVDGNLTQLQADEISQVWMERYSGVQNAFKPAILKNGAEPVKLGFNLADAQFIEQKHYSLTEIARIFRVSAVGLLGAFTTGREPTVAEDLHRFLQVDMAPRLARIEQALQRDPDLFPDDTLFPEFLPDMVLRPDIQMRFAAYKDAAQGGWMTSNEIRERENLPPHPDGVSLQQTPVGGAPNQSQTPTAGNGNGKVPAPTPTPLGN